VYGNAVTAGDYTLAVDVDPEFTTSGGTELSVAEGFGDQSFPEVGRNAAGQSVFTWINWGGTREAENGQPASGVITANVDGEPSGNPRVAVASDGSFAIVWSRSSNIYQRRFDANGNALTGEVLVSSAGVASGEPRIAVAPNGSFIVTWTSFSHGDPDGGIFAQLVNANGTLAGTEIHVNTSTLKYQGGPNPAFRPDGSFLVMWHSEVGSELALLGRRFAANGSAAGSEFRINGAGRALYPALAVDPSDATVVAWKNHTGSGVESIRARRLAADDTLLGTEIIVGQGLTPLDFEPDVAFGAEARFVIAWTTSQETDGSGIGAQAFHADGTRFGPEYVLNQQVAQPQTRPVLAGTGAEAVFAVWQSNQGGSVAENVRGLVFNLGPNRQPILRVTDTRGIADDHFIDFGRFAAPVTSVTQTVTIHNDGNAALEVSNLELYGAGADEFSYSGPASFSVMPGGNRAITITYHGDDGSDFAGLRFGHNNPHEGSVGWISLLAEVALPTLQVGITDVSVEEGTGSGEVFARITRLNTDTGSDMTVNLVSSDPARVSVPATAVIPAGAEFALVPLDVLDNSVAGDNATVTITVSASGFTTGADSLEVIDNEPGGVVVRESGGTTRVTEGGATDSYTLVLTTQPTADVTITLMADSQVSVSPTTVTFTSANWNLPRTITVTAVDDGVVEDEHTGTIAHAVASADPVYHGIAVSNVVAVIRAANTESLFPIGAGSTGTDRGRAVAVDVDGNVYMAGTFQGTVDFDAGPGLALRTSAGSNDSFVAKYSPQGVLLWATRFGGSESDQANAIAVDSSGEVHVAGTTASAGLGTSGSFQPNHAGSTDGFVLKLDAAGNMVFATYLGGGSSDEASGIAIDSLGSILVTGATTSANFPTANAAQGSFGGGGGDFFVTKLNPAGTAVTYSTFLGRIGNDVGSAIAVDGSGNAYVAGYTRSSNFPIVGSAVRSSFVGSAEGVVLKFSPTGTLLYSSFLGGNDTFGEGLESIAVDSAGNIYVAGGGGSADYPLVNPVPDNSGGATYVSKISADGSTLLFSTTLRANGGGHSIAVDDYGAIYVTGQTSAAGLPVTDGSTVAGDFDAFVAKITLSAAGSKVAYAAYLGGAGADIGWGIAVDAERNVYIAGQFAGTGDFEYGTATTSLTTAGCDDSFLAVVSGTNRAPVANADSAASVGGESKSVFVLANDSDADGDRLTITILDQPNHGTATVNTNGTPADTSDDFVVYVPAPGFAGTDRFRYEIADGFGGVSRAWVVMTATAPPPAALLQDNFNDNSLDTSKWRIDTSVERGPASVTETAQAIQLMNRGHLITQARAVGIDRSMTLQEPCGRPVPLLDEHDMVRELIS
jgi:hypothetical protein